LGGINEETVVADLAPLKIRAALRSEMNTRPFRAPLFQTAHETDPMKDKEFKKRDPFAVPAKQRSGAGPMEDRRAQRGGARNVYREDIEGWQQQAGIEPEEFALLDSAALGVEAVLFDLDGVIYNGEQAIAKAAEAVAWVREQNIPHLFVTNTTSRPRRALVEKLARFGVTASEAQIFNPLVAAARWLRSQPEGRVALFVPEQARAEFEGLPQVPEHAEQGAAYVVIGDLGEAWNFRTLNRAFRLLHHNPNATLVALGMTRYWKAPEGISLDVAPFVVALEHATGRKAVVLGKPAAPFFLGAVDQLGLAAENVLMIGDDIRADVGGAQAAGLKGALVKTGKFRPTDLEGEIRPDVVFESVADLPQWW
jgi:HAD superfamily hydrolase (TIGR01458 family)